MHDGPEFPPSAIIRTAIHAAAASTKPLRIVDAGKLVGVVDRAQILEAISGPVDSLEREAPPENPAETAAKATPAPAPAAGAEAAR
jgi:hypothetical protein